MKFQEFMNKSLLMALYRNYHLWVASLTKELKPYKLNLNDGLILLAVFFESSKETQPTQLSNLLNLPKDQISQSLKRLEILDLITRKTGAEDSRKRKIMITALGKKRAAELVKIFDRQESKLEKESLNT